MFAYWMQVLCYTFLKCFNHLLLFIDMAAAAGCTGRIIKALKQSWNSPPIILSNRVHGGCNSCIKCAKDVLYRGSNCTKGQAPRTFRDMDAHRDKNCFRILLSVRSAGDLGDVIPI